MIGGTNKDGGHKWTRRREPCIKVYLLLNFLKNKYFSNIDFAIKCVDAMGMFGFKFVFPYFSTCPSSFLFVPPSLLIYAFFSIWISFLS